MHYTYSTCFSSSNQGEFETFPPNDFRSIWLYICHILAIFVFQYHISSSFTYKNFPVYKHYGPFHHQFSGIRMVYKIWYNSPNTVFLCIQSNLLTSRSCLLLFCTFYLSVSSMHDFYRILALRTWQRTLIRLDIKKGLGNSLKWNCLKTMAQRLQNPTL